MRDEDKPFICYKQGWNIKISPRNAAGWRAFGLWLLPFFAATAVFVAVVAAMDEKGVSATTINLALVLPFILGTIIWAIAMIRWMMARSEIVDVNGLLEMKREQDRAKKRSGRL
jgi:uncharacterized membrane protein